MAYQSWSVVFGEQPSAAKWNILGTNDASFNDGTGIANGVIVPNHMNFGAQTASQTTLGTTTSTSFVTTLTTSGATPSVTATVPASGSVLIFMSLIAFSSVAEVRCSTSYVVSGASTVTAATNETAGRHIVHRETSTSAGSARGGTWLHTGLTAGSTTFQAAHAVQANTGSFDDVLIGVLPIGD